ncbi:MAG: inositol monophosphatase [Rhodospirillales bacterium]|nr:inositol monophosphatase [Rhodospirillales bacterium]
MPRFRQLGSGDIREKKPGDLVTVADMESERRLSAMLPELLPGSRVVGEEASAADPSVLDALAGKDPVWIVDPVDGTNNFANGKECFALIVALMAGGKTLAGWIHDPVAGVSAMAAPGEGAWMDDGTRLEIPRGIEISAMTGTAPKKVRKRLAERGPLNGHPMPAKLLHYRCAGREYLDMVRGRLHFARFGRWLKPWDHAAGMLIHREAGGHAALCATGAALRAADGIVEGPLLVAPNADDWQALRSIIFEDRSERS